METRIQVNTYITIYRVSLHLIAKDLVCKNIKYFSTNLLIRIEIRRENIGSEAHLTVDVEAPWYGKYGLYNHFHAESKGRIIRYLLSLSTSYI